MEAAGTVSRTGGTAGTLRVLQLVQKPQRRGAEIFAHQLTAALRQQGHTVHIAYLYPFAGDAPLPLANGDLVLGGREKHPAEKVPGFHPGLLRRLLRTVRELSPTVVQVNGGRALKYGALARGVDAAGGWSLLYRNIGEPQRWVRGSARRWVYRRLLIPRLDGVVAVSETTLAALVAFYGAALGNVPRVALPRAVDLRRFAPRRGRDEVRAARGVAPGAPVVVYVGSLSAEKRLDRLIDCLPGLLADLPRLRLWVLGDGPLRGELERRAAEIGVAAVTWWAGTRDDVADHLAAADVLALCSDTEGIPGVVLEAGAAGLPVVATRVGGVAECLVDGETGLLVEPGKSGDLENALRTLLADPETAHRMGRTGRRNVEEHFSLDRIAESYAELYRCLAERRGGRP